MADHPGPFVRKSLAAVVGLGDPALPPATAAAAARPVTRLLFRRRTAGRVRASLVDRVRLTGSHWQAGKCGRAERNSGRTGAACRTRVRIAVLRHRPDRSEATAFRTLIFVNRHDRLPPQRSCDSGTSTPPLICLTGPEAFGPMSNSNICVGNHSVAQALGMSTTPLMCPCTGAVPRIE